METPPSLKAALLDFDYTLVILPVDWDTLRARLAQVFNPFGFTPNLRPLYTGISESLEKLGSQGVSPARRAAVRRRLNALITEAEWAAEPGATPQPGSRELIEALRTSGYKVIIQSSNSANVIRSALDRLRFPAVDAIVGRESSRFGKPHPHGVRRALRQLGLRGDQAVVIGDGDFDVQLGQAIGALTIRVGGEGRSANAEHLVSSLSDVKRILVGAGKTGRAAV